MPMISCSSARPSSRSARGVRAAFAALACAASAVAFQAHAAECGRPCVEVADSVVNAAGTDPKLKKLIAGMRFDGPRLSAASKPDIQRIATGWGKTGSGVLTLTVHADRGLAPPLAKAQAASRATALQDALVGAGLPKERVQVAPAG